MALHATFFELVETTDCLSFSSPSARRMDFETFIFSLSDSDILRFLRSILEEVEVTRGIMDYHLRVQPCPITGGFAIIIHFNQRRRPPKNRENCMSCDLSTPHFESFVSSDFMLSEFEYTRTWLDLAARPMYIVTPIQVMIALAAFIANMKQIISNNSTLIYFPSMPKGHLLSAMQLYWSYSGVVCGLCNSFLVAHFRTCG